MEGLASVTSQAFNPIDGMGKMAAGAMQAVGAAMEGNIGGMIDGCMKVMEGLTSAMPGMSLPGGGEAQGAQQSGGATATQGGGGGGDMMQMLMQMMMQMMRGGGQ